MSRRHFLPTLALVAMTCIAGCKILPTLSEEEKAAAATAEAFNPDKQVEDEWAARYFPISRAKPGRFRM